MEGERGRRATNLANWRISGCTHAREGEYSPLGDGGGTKRRRGTARRARQASKRACPAQAPPCPKMIDPWPRPLGAPCAVNECVRCRLPPISLCLQIANRLAPHHLVYIVIVRGSSRTPSTTPARPQISKPATSVSDITEPEHDAPPAHLEGRQSSQQGTDGGGVLTIFRTGTRRGCRVAQTRRVAWRKAILAKLV